MIYGSHVVIFTKDAEADRSFFKDVLQMTSVDAGGGWLVFALPPAEVAFHPAAENNQHKLYLMCEDLHQTLQELEQHGVEWEDPTDENWGIVTDILLPGGGQVGLYQPKHPVAF